MDVISSQVQSYLQQESKMLPLVTDFSSLVVKGSKQVEIPRSGGFTVNDKTENTAEDAQVITYATDAIALSSHKVIQWLLEDIASEQATIAVVQDALLKSGKDMARQVDQDIIDALELPSAAAPDHRIGYAGAAIAEVDILAARELLIKQFINPDECFLGVSPASETAMLKISNFIKAQDYGGGAPLFSGEIGKVFGVRVIVHNDFEDLKSIMWHPSALGYATQIGPRFQSDSDLPNLATRYSLDMLYGVKLLDSGKRNVLIGTAA
jgi:N4-gp56 family major capsid protein